MRFGTKAMISACFVAPAIAAVILAGAGTASAQTTGAAAHTTSTEANWPPPPFCNPFQKERWNLNGFNTVDVTYKLFSHYTYTVDFVQRGSCLSGWLTDPYFPVTRPISGSVNGNFVRFSFTYPSFVEGTRTYTGSIDRFGFVSGGWSQTGFAFPNFGTFTLGSTVARACPPWIWWTQFCTVP
jgi:hypothetical protein